MFHMQVAHPSTSYLLFPWTRFCGPRRLCACKATHRDKQLCAFATVVWLCQLAEQAWLQAVGWSQSTWREPTQERGEHANRTPDLFTVRSQWATLPPTYKHTYIQYTYTHINAYICMHSMHVTLPQDWISFFCIHVGKSIIDAGLDIHMYAGTPYSQGYAVNALAHAWSRARSDCYLPVFKLSCNEYGFLLSLQNTIGWCLYSALRTRAKTPVPRSGENRMRLHSPLCVSPPAWQMHLLSKSWWIYRLNSKSKAHSRSRRRGGAPPRRRVRHASHLSRQSLIDKAALGRRHRFGLLSSPRVERRWWMGTKCSPCLWTSHIDGAGMPRPSVPLWFPSNFFSKKKF